MTEARAKPRMARYQVMATMNKQFDVPKMQQSMQAFEQESMKMDMAGEMSTPASDRG